MRIIISTVVFARLINRAIKREFNVISVSKENQLLKFMSDTKEISCEIHTTRDCVGEKITAFINPIQFFKLKKFLKKLPEQPIVVEFDEYNEKEVNIKLSQFVASF